MSNSSALVQIPNPLNVQAALEGVGLLPFEGSGVPPADLADSKGRLYRNDAQVWRRTDGQVFQKRDGDWVLLPGISVIGDSIYQILKRLDLTELSEAEWAEEAAKIVLIDGLIDGLGQIDGRVDSVQALAGTTATSLTATQGTVAILGTSVSANTTAIAAVQAQQAAGEKPFLLSVARLVTDNVDPATTFVVGAVVDGRTLLAGDRVGKAYDNAGAGVANNGIWEVQASGNAIRPADADGTAELLYSRFGVDGGAHAGEVWSVRNTAAISVGATPIILKLAIKAEGTQAEVTGGRLGRDNLGQAMADALEGRVTDAMVPDGYASLWASSASDAALLAGYDPSQRDTVHPGADRSIGFPVWKIVVGFGQSNMQNRNAWPPLSAMIRNRYSSWMPSNLGCCGPGMTDIRTYGLDNLSPAYARMELADNSLEGETDWHGLIAQLLAGERAAKQASAPRIFLNCGVGGRPIAELTADLYSSWATALVEFDPQYDGELFSVVGDNGTHLDAVTNAAVSNSGTFRWSGGVITRTSSEILWALQNIINGVRHYHRLLRGNVEVEFVDVDHGESDEDKTKTYYLTAFVTGYDKVETRLKAIDTRFCIFGYNADGSERRPAFYCSQPPVRNTQLLYGEAYTWGAQEAMFELDATSRLGPDQRQIVLAGPTYAYAHCDTSHRGPKGVAMVGSSKGYGINRHRKTGRTGAFRFLPAATIRDGKIILQSDPSTKLQIKSGGAYPEWPNKGFVVRNGGSNISITSVAVDTVDPTCIALTPQTTPVVGMEAHYARYCTWNYDPGPGAGGNVAEDAEVPVAMLPGEVMFNWAMSCRSVVQ